MQQAAVRGDGFLDGDRAASHNLAAMIIQAMAKIGRHWAARPSMISGKLTQGSRPGRVPKAAIHPFEAERL
jgi:hypothetical protein